MTVCMGYTAKTSQERAGKRRWKGAGTPCGENGRTQIPQLLYENVVKLTTFSSRDAEEINVIKMITLIDRSTSKRTFIHLLQQRKSMWPN